MLIVHSVLGYCVLLVIAYLSGRRTRSIPWKTIGMATVLQLLLAAILLQPAIRSLVFGLASDLTTLLKKTALTANKSLLFSGMSAESFVRQHGPVVALEIAAILIFVASLSRVLYHYRLLPWVIARLSRFMQKSMGLSSAESVGTTKAPLLAIPVKLSGTSGVIYHLAEAKNR